MTLRNYKTLKVEEARVAAIILTTGSRAKYLARALGCLKSQTHPNYFPVIVDSTPAGETKAFIPAGEFKDLAVIQSSPKSIGELRNVGNLQAVQSGAEVIMHWDDDDYSAPERMGHQVDQLKYLHAVGWRDLAFWDSRIQKSFRYQSGNTRYACGTSLCYRVQEWQRQPFADLRIGEDAAWCSQVRPWGLLDSYPLLVAEVHGANTCSRVDADAQEWSRTPARDAHLMEVMAL